MALPQELSDLTRSEWDRLVEETAIDAETALIVNMYLFERKPQNLIADLLQEYGIYLSRPTVTRRWKNFVSRALVVKNKLS